MMSRSCHHNSSIVKQLFDRHLPTGLIFRKRSDVKVDRPVAYVCFHCRKKTFRDFEPSIGIAPPKRIKHTGQQRYVRGGGQSDRNRSGALTFELKHFVHRTIQLCLDNLAPSHQGFAYRSQLHSGCTAYEYRKAQFVLKITDAAGDGRLRHTQMPSGAPKPAKFSYGQ